MVTKFCSICKKQLENTEFAKKQRNKIQPKCKNCTGSVIPQNKVELAQNKVELTQNNTVLNGEENQSNMVVNISGFIVNENINLRNENMILKTKLEEKESLIKNLEEQLKNQKELLGKIGLLEVENEKQKSHISNLEYKLSVAYKEIEILKNENSELRLEFSYMKNEIMKLKESEKERSLCIELAQIVNSLIKKLAIEFKTTESQIKKKCKLLKRDVLNLDDKGLELLKNISEKYPFKEYDFEMFSDIIDVRNYGSHPKIIKFELEKKIHESNQYEDEDKETLIKVLDMYEGNVEMKRRR